MGLTSFLAKQARKPSGWFGRVVVSWILNKANASLEDMSLELMDIKEEDEILKIGFGNGRMISNMAAKISFGKVIGIEISEDMIKVARKKNMPYIEEGKVKILKASVEEIPFDNESFDKVFTANTIYFWPDAQVDILEVKSVLKKGGTF
jgi:ubiquinone/menaquinone biosynthesis C-methylase UbiE